nr:transposase [Nitrosomonas ureae]
MTVILLPEILRHVEQSRGRAAKQAVCDRGYRGKREVNGTQIILPGKGLKKDTRYQKDKKRKQCRRRAAIEPIIGHLKSDYRMTRNYLKGAMGDRINLLMAAAAWNLKLIAVAHFFVFLPVAKITSFTDSLIDQN